MKTILTLIALSGMFSGAQAQTGSLTGLIKFPDGSPATSVNVGLKDTNHGSSTNTDGKYKIINVKEGAYTLIASFIGFKVEEVQVYVKAGENTEVAPIIMKKSSTLLDEVVISASRNSEVLSEIPASVSVVHVEEIAGLTQATTNINDILEFSVPGIAPSTGTYSNWGQTLRGRKLLVMVDGVPQSTPLRNGQVAMKTINPNDLQRVEVIKGATSIYGNGGDGGFINYITRRPVYGKKISGTTNIWGTSNLAETQDAFGGGIYQSLSGAIDKFQYHISGSYEKTGNKYDAQGDPLLPTYGLDNTKIASILGKTSYLLAYNQQLTLTASHYQSRQNSPFNAVNGSINVVDGNGNYIINKGYGELNTGDDLNEPTGVTTTNMRAKYELKDIFNGSTDFASDLYYQKAKNIFFYSPRFENGGQSVINSKKYGLRPNFNSTFSFNASITLSLTYGLDILNDKTNQGLLDGRLWVPNLNLFSYAPYLQVSLQFNEKWAIKTGVRHDQMKLEIDDYATLPYDADLDGDFNQPVEVTGGTLSYSNTSFNFGARYIENQKFTPYVSFSQGFSLPDLGRTLRGASASNINDIQLEPVVTNNYEFGFLSKFKHVRFEAVAYYSTSNLGTGLDFNNETNRFELERQPQKIFGGEVAVDFRVLANKLQFGTSYSYVEGLKHAPGDENDLSYIGGDVIAPPKATAYVTVLPVKKLRTSLRLVRIGDRERFDPVLRGDEFFYNYREAPVKGYTLLNFTANYNVSSALEVSLALNNLLNEFYLPARAQWAAPLRSQTTAGEGINNKLTVTYNF